MDTLPHHVVFGNRIADIVAQTLLQLIELSSGFLG
jgi:hypothetical protein